MPPKVIYLCPEIGFIRLKLLLNSVIFSGVIRLSHPLNKTHFIPLKKGSKLPNTWRLAATNLRLMVKNLMSE